MNAIDLNILMRDLKQIGWSIMHYEKKKQLTERFLASKESMMDETFINPIKDEITFYEAKLYELHELAGEILLSIPLYRDWLVRVKGLMVTSLIKKLAIVDFRKAKHPSSLYRLAGLVDPTQLPEEERNRYNRKLKTALFLQSLNFIGHPPHLWQRMVNRPPRFDGGYARLYVKFRKQTDEKHPDWSATHRHLDALRKLSKVYLTHIFVVHHFLTNKRAEVHYAVAKLNHNYIYMPPIDVGEKPEWWHELAEVYESQGITPIEP